MLLVRFPIGKSPVFWAKIKHKIPKEQILDYDIEYTKLKFPIFGFIKMGLKFTNNIIKIIYSYLYAKKCQKKYDQNEVNREKNKLEKQNKKILIISHFYNIDDKFISTYIKDYFFLTLGSLIYAFAIEGFLIPSQIIDGGITGTSMILSTLSGIPLGYLIVGINLPFIILALQKLGKRFVFSTLYSILVFAIGVTVFNQVFNGHCIIDNLDLFLVAVFGGLILGARVGLIIRNGASVDGTEILAVYATKKIAFSVGEIIMFFNVFIFNCSGMHACFDCVVFCGKTESVKTDGEKNIVSFKSSFS